MTKENYLFWGLANQDPQEDRLEYLETLTKSLRDDANAKGYVTITEAVEAAPSR